MSKLSLYFALFLALLLLPAPALRAADTLPGQIADDAFWKFIDTSSESGGVFQSENFLSNETGFQVVIPSLKEKARPGGVYMGVGPEQNFTYIAGIRPKIAFIIDIRRQNMLEHMIYKAAFEMSSNRPDFLARVFARKRPAGLSEKSTVDQLFTAYLEAQPLDNDAFEKSLQEIKDLLVKKHKFGLTGEDLENIGHVYDVFHEFGPDINYNSGAFRGRGGGGMPNYAELMTATDAKGEERSYLASEENYGFIRDLENKNLIVPLTGDFGGPRAIRSVGRYLKDHAATVTAFYTSNVEQYLFQGNGNRNGGWTNFYDNVAALPLDATSTFIRSAGGGFRQGGFGGAGGGMRAPNVLASIQETVLAVKAGSIQSYNDIFLISR
jgi:hypothetical protein